jgi:hypothetical protein
LANEPARRDRFGQTGRKFVEQNFSIDKMVADQYAVYLQVAAQKKTVS